MNKKAMLIPILALLLLSVPTAIADYISISGNGEYSQTTAFSDVSDYVELTGEWIFDSTWGDISGRPFIDNTITLFAGATFYEHAVSPRGIYYSEGLQYWHGSDEDANPGLDLLTVVTYPTSNIQDIADIKMRGYDFTFEATAGSYTSTKFLRVLDSYNNVLEDGTDIEEMDWARFQVTDRTDGAYVVGGITEYEERYPNQGLAWTKLNFMQTFTQGSDISGITVYHSVSDWVRSTAFFGYDAAGELDGSLDWYAEATDETTPFEEGRDAFYASFVDDEAHFWALYGKPAIGYTLDAYNSIVEGVFDAWGSVVDVDWEFTGSTLHKTDDPTGTGMTPYSGWSANLDMEP